MNSLEISTPALLFPAVSLLFLSYTNRFLHLAALVRNLHRDWLELKDEALRAQIDNLRKRLLLIRWMQLLGATSLLLCVVSMIALFYGLVSTGHWCFVIALGLMAVSLASLILEIFVSGGALQILLERVERED